MPRYTRSLSIFFSFFATALIGSLFASRAQAESISESPSPQVVLQGMERVADWQLAHPSSHRPDDWTQAAGYAGIMALADISSSPRFLASMEAMGQHNAWKLGSRLYHADDHCVAQTYVEVFLRRRDPAMLVPLRESFDAILAEPRDADLDFDKPGALDHWVWCDALFMSPPTWTRLYYVTGKQAYLDYMIAHWWKTSDYLYDPTEHLFFRDSHSFTKREANGRKIFWSRGNGWVMAGLARILDFFPLANPARPKFEEQFKAMATTVLGLQQSDGLWRSSMLDPASYPMRETSGSGFFCYALAWGVNHGYLDRATFEPSILKCWSALNACVTPEGKLTYVQPIGAAPKTFDPQSTEVYGVGAYLLAGREVYQLMGGTVPRSIPGT